MQAQYDTRPVQMEVRDLCYKVTRRGVRTRPVTLITMLTDQSKYLEKEIAELCGDRWQVEVELGELKTSLGMDVLPTKTIEERLKEIWMLALVYNLA